MPDASLTISGDLIDYLVELLQPLLDERGLVVWYDRDGALEAPLRATAERHGWTMTPGSGARNILAARVEIEAQLESDGLLLVRRPRAHRAEGPEDARRCRRREARAPDVAGRRADQ